jgi:hypothetical protein
LFKFNFTIKKEESQELEPYRSTVDWNDGIKKIEPDTLTGQIFAGNQDFSDIVSTS